MRDRVVISLDGLEEEIVSSKGVVRRDIKILKLKGKGERDFFSPTVRLNYGDGGDIWRKYRRSVSFRGEGIYGDNGGCVELRRGKIRVEVCNTVGLKEIKRVLGSY